jgi:hypothetical protein
MSFITSPLLRLVLSVEEVFTLLFDAPIPD